MPDPVPPDELGLSLPNSKDVKLNPETPATVKLVKTILDLLQTRQEEFRQTDESTDNRLRLFTNCVQPDGDRWRLSVIRVLNEEVVDIRMNRLRPEGMTEDEWKKSNLRRPDDMSEKEWRKLEYEYKEDHQRFAYRVYLFWGNAGQEYKKSTAFQMGLLNGRPSYIVNGLEGELIISDDASIGELKRISAEKALELLTNGTLMLPDTMVDRLNRI